MNYQISPPLGYDTALTFVKNLQGTWNQGDTSQIIQRFAFDCEWRDNERQIQGVDEISEFLQRRQKEQLHYLVEAELWSHSFFRLAVSFQSEWQNAKRGKWFRSSGHIFIRIDNIGRIKEFCISTSGVPISVDERRLGVSPS